ncbi:uncharacterized protein LOC129593605 isoform X2 [Paramacrobiotus metropolitanus]|uniref:uncharacterized protein LOC129593605 isoform X2 n=1 Tax=Paramacrobiotus metropolitanus TaxID=2943436 RepID=UPI002445E36C|nr:uncharacterized protein LOC129593605 isoform X2 [Paramacrobiotus metropolitanus]
MHYAEPAPSVLQRSRFSSNIRSLPTLACTPDTHPWIGKKGFCVPTDQLDTYCETLEASASIRHCPGNDNWCCYDPAQPRALLIQPCTPDLPVENDAGFCAPTDMLKTYCNELEISASRDCQSYSGNWCCYRNRQTAL